MTPVVALLLLDRAEREHKRANWRIAARALGEIVRAQIAQDGRKDAPAVRHEAKASRLPAAGIPPKPASLIAFLAEAGIRDPGGELRCRDLDRWHREKPFRRRLVRDDGALSLEGAAESAWEAGFFPDAPSVDWSETAPRCPVTVEMLIAAIEREAQGDFRRLHPSEREPDPDEEAYWRAVEEEAA